MRRRRRVDSNQAEIVAALRAAGASVEVLSDVGRGVPDLLAGLRGRNVLLEVKPPERDDLTPAEETWHQKWRGQVAVVQSPQEAVAAVCGHATR